MSGASNGFLRIKGQSGKFTGGSSAFGHEGSIEVFRWHQTFTYGKQSFDEEVSRFQLQNELDQGIELKEISRLRRNMPDFKTLNRYAKGGDLAESRDEHFIRLRTELEKWRKNFESELGNLDQGWKTSNKTLDTSMVKFKNFLESYSQRFSGSKHSEMIFEKYTDKASYKLLTACCTAEKLTECHFTLYRSADIPAAGSKINLAKSAKEFVEITLEDAIITRFEIKHSGEDLPKEIVAINYDKAKFKFVEGDPSTGQRGRNKVISWDWTTGKAVPQG